jgi:outer membrane receptor for ferrienterochelin and colicins
MITRCIIILLTVAGSAHCQPLKIMGTVRNADDRQPLAFASVHIAGTSTGVMTDEQGNFSLKFDRSTNNKITLVTSFVGYEQDSLVWKGHTRVSISLKPTLNSLQEVVVVSGTMKEVSKMNSAIPVEIYTPALFLKNPTPSIFESLGMVNGVQPQLNCNVCNTGDIHINGMEGPYTMVLIDGMPIVSSLSTVYGLSGIPNSMVKRIEVVKGPASTLYGSEAVGGLINIITNNPATSPLFKTDILVTSLKEYNLDVSTKWNVKSGSALLGINYFNFRNKLDVNEDNFTDITQQQRISIFNKWNFIRKEERSASFAWRYIFEDRWGGELQWTRNHRGSDQVYGESIYTNRIEAIGNYQLPIQSQKVIFDYSYNYHKQDSYYGIVQYLADQHVAFGQLRWDKTAGKHDLLAGIPFRYTYYDDNTVGTASDTPGGESNHPMETFLPGIFVQDEIQFTPRMTLLTGVRYDRHNRHGNIFSPRISAKYSPNKMNTFRLSTGNGFRVVNLFTEDHAALTGARKVVIANELKPEQSWNVNLNYATTLIHSNGYVGLDASAFYTYFTNKITGDFITAPDSIIYDNLDGHAVSRGITLNTDIAFTSGLKIIAGVTWMDVYQVQKNNQGNETKTEQLFAPVLSGTYSVSYAFDRFGLTVDLTGRLNGPMYLPVVPNDFRPERSPWFTLMNIQVTKTFTSGLEVYAGVKNLLNFVPDDPLLRPFDPFDKNVTVNNPNGYTFDTTYNYAPVQGIKGFAGLRYSIQ